MLKIVQNMGLKLVVANELFDIGKICELYNRSKIVLNHATDVGQPFGQGFGYQCRHFEAGFCHTTVLSNKIVNDETLKYVAQFSNETELVDCVKKILGSRGLQYTLADGLYNELNAKHLPEHRAQEMVEFVRSIS
jgi:hypothetical protein